MITEKKHNKLIIAIVFVALLGVLVAGLIMKSVYDYALKPQDFSSEKTVASGDGTGYYRHNYAELNETEKKIYASVLEEIYNMPEKIEIPALGDSDLTKIFNALSQDNPDLFCMGTTCKAYQSGFKTYFEPTYVITLEEYRTRLEEVQGIASAIIEGTKQYTSVYEKELYVHDYIINHCSYSDPNTNPNANSIYGCLVEGRAGCEGYSKTFQYIMSALNIDNRLVTGESAEDGINYIGHMWNYVVLDGQGYFVDVTWDDPKAADPILKHVYFNVTTADILVGHKDIQQNLPLCTSKNYNYFYRENTYFDIVNSASFSDSVKNAIALSLSRGYKNVELRFKDGAVLEQAKNELFTEGAIYRAYKDLGIIVDTAGAQVYYSVDDKTNVICLYF